MLVLIHLKLPSRTGLRRSTKSNRTLQAEQKLQGLVVLDTTVDLVVNVVMFAAVSNARRSTDQNRISV